MKHKIFALLVITAIMLGACGAPSTEAPVAVPTEIPVTQVPAMADTVAPAEPVTIRFSSWGKPEQNAAIASMVAAFKAKYPNIEISEEYDPYDGYFEKKTTQIAGNQLPDVFALDTSSICDYASANRIVDLTEATNAGTPTGDLLATLSPSALANLNIGGKQYAYPLAGGALLLYYNKDMFDAAGLAYPDPSWTFQDVLDAAAKMSVDNNGDGELDQWGYYPNYYNSEDFASILHRFGARWLSPDGKTAVSNSPEAVAAVQFIQDLIYKYKVTPRPQDVEGIESPFAAGLVAMYEDISPFMSTARDITDFKWDVTSIPLGFNGQQGGGPLRGNPNFVVSAASPNIPQATLLAAYLASPEAQTILGQAQGRMPVQADGLAAWAVKPPENISVISDILTTQPDIVESLCSPNSDEQGDAIQRALEGEILNNSLPASEIMDNLTKEIQAILDK